MKAHQLIATLVAASTVSASSPLTKGFLRHELELLATREVLPISVLEDEAQLIADEVIPVIWPEESKLPKLGQFILASAWVAMLASIPFIIPLVDHRPVSKTQMGVGAAMLVVLFGGFYLFTNIILFQSIHFKTLRPLTIVECIYFMSQVITTVGYGDITPAKPRGQIFVALYVLGALFIIANLISDLTDHMVRKYEEFKKQQIAAAGQVVATPRSSLGNLIKPEKPSAKSLMFALAVFAVLDTCWIMFFFLFPGEGKTLFQAIYMSVITLSTVGFGAFTPVTEEGMIFGAFWMLFGSAALVNVITNFTEYMVSLSKYEQCIHESESEAVTHLKGLTVDGTVVTDVQFVKFALHHKSGVPGSEIETILQAFKALGPKNGTVSQKQIEECLTAMARDDPTFNQKALPTGSKAK